jgi:hypothetical protein
MFTLLLSSDIMKRDCCAPLSRDKSTSTKVFRFTTSIVCACQAGIVKKQMRV